jgi:hypothetical protein
MELIRDGSGITVVAVGTKESPKGQPNVGALNARMR